MDKQLGTRGLRTISGLGYMPLQWDQMGIGTFTGICSNLVLAFLTMLRYICAILKLYCTLMFGGHGVAGMEVSWVLVAVSLSVTGPVPRGG